MSYYKKYCVSVGMEAIKKGKTSIQKIIENTGLTGNILTKFGVEGMVILRRCHRDFMQKESEKSA